MHHFQPADDLQVHLICLAESHPRIENDLIPRDARRVRQSDALSHIFQKFRDKRSIICVVPVVHQAARRFALCDNMRHPGIVFQPPDIVDQIRSRFQCFPRYRALVRVHGERRVKACFQDFYDRNDSGDLFFI